MKNRLTQTLAARVLLGSLLAAGAVPARADAVPGMYWTHTGSTGTVDPADLGLTNLDFEVITNVGPAAGTIDVRYNVVAVDGLETPPMSPRDFALFIRYRDHGSQSQVVARLYQTSIETGERTLIKEFDSNFDEEGEARPQLAALQMQRINVCHREFDFTRNTYYVGVQLIRKTTNGILPGMPALAALQIKPWSCLE